MTGSAPGEDLREGKEKVAGSGADFRGISPIEGADQREEEGRILKGLPLGIVKPCHMIRVKEMGQEDLLQEAAGTRPWWTRREWNIFPIVSRETSAAQARRHRGRPARRQASAGWQAED
jgi:hypothetical protein